MTGTDRRLTTRRGTIRLPACFPVTTFGEKHPLDRLLRPYLPRLAAGMMVSFHYARGMGTPPRLPLLIDSGGFASLMPGARVAADGKLGVLETAGPDGECCVHPRDVLELQEESADVAFTLDFPIPPGTAQKEARRRQRLTIENALWVLANRRRKDLPLFACVQAWDERSARACARAYANAGFDGVAVGGLVPRLRDLDRVVSLVTAVREEAGDRPLHAFGIGKPDVVARLFREGVDSTDSSAYARLAAAGRTWDPTCPAIDDPTPLERLQLALRNLAVMTSARLPLSFTGQAGPLR
jgi:helicase